MSTYLDEIIAFHRRRAAADGRRVGDLVERAHHTPQPRDAHGALSAPGLSVIAEIKRRSPSRGDLAPDLDPAALARDYADGGASWLSVLTDTEHFGGSEEDLRIARGAVSIPVLRKDFTVSAADVCDARLMGADAVLLIVAALDDEELRGLSALARELGLLALVEVHDPDEVERARRAEAEVIGVNQRNLVTFDVDHGLALDLARLVPPGTLKVAESGIRGAGDAEAVAEAGYDAVLVGESLLVSDDPRRGVAALAGIGG